MTSDEPPFNSDAEGAPKDALAARPPKKSGRSGHANEPPVRLRWCTECGDQGVAAPWQVCSLCGAEQIEPFREGWTESD